MNDQTTYNPPHVVNMHMDLETHEVIIRQCTLKEDAIEEIKRQPFFEDSEAGKT